MRPNKKNIAGLSTLPSVAYFLDSAGKQYTKLTRKRNAGHRQRKPVSQITDRMKRYRANEDANRPAGRKQCRYCGAAKNVGVHHVDGNENNGQRRNLAWACKSCNGRIAAYHKKHGIGRRVQQYNPSKASRKSMMDAYGQAIKVMRGDFDGDVGAAMDTINQTPEDIRSSYTAKSWAVRRQRYGPSGRGNPAKFDRCVKAVKKRGGAVNAYAVCTAAGTRANNVKKGQTYDKYYAQKAAQSKHPERYALPKKKNPTWRKTKAQQRKADRAFEKKYGKGTASSAAARKAYIDRLIRGNRGRGNPADAAAARYEYFHGRPPEKDTIVKTDRHYHKNLSGIGELKELLILGITGDRKVKLEGFKGAMLSETEKGTQLYIRGGDQGVNLKDFAIDSPHEQEILGALLNVVYFTRKDHLRPEDGGTANYKHKFGRGQTKKYVFG